MGITTLLKTEGCHPERNGGSRASVFAAKHDEKIYDSGHDEESEGKRDDGVPYFMPQKFVQIASPAEIDYLENCVVKERHA